MPIRYTSLAAALVVTNQKCPSHQPFMSTLPGIAYGTTVSVTTKTVDGKDPWELTAPDENGAVDLGLSVKQAAYNVGATKPEEYGDYYAWGEVETKEDYAETNYEFTNVDQYGDYYQVLPGGFSDISKTQYDPATVNWGKEWRIPRKLELVELFDKSTFVRTTYNSIEGLRVIGPNGNSIFLPASGYRNEYGGNYKGEFGYYWTSIYCDSYTWSSYKSVYIFGWNRSALGNWSTGISDIVSYYGLPIRAVKD